jgi:hypothetical protein
MESERGIYQDYVVFTKDGLKVHMIMLDVRFHHNEDFKDDRLGYR